MDPSHTVLDLGCGTGDVAHLLAARVGDVLGIDRDPALLAAARGGAPENCRFLEADITRLEAVVDAPVDGIWAGFVAAYFPDLAPVLAGWARLLRPGGWLALVEVDGMFTGHRPLPASLRDDLAAFGERARGGYDFDMGGKLAGFAHGAGLEVSCERDFDDPELAFQGPAAPGIVTAWRARFARLGGIRKAFGDTRHAAIENAFLACLSAADHRCSARVVLVSAVKPT